MARPIERRSIEKQTSKTLVFLRDLYRRKIPFSPGRRLSTVRCGRSSWTPIECSKKLLIFIITVSALSISAWVCVCLPVVGLYYRYASYSHCTFIFYMYSYRHSCHFCKLSVILFLYFTFARKYNHSTVSHQHDKRAATARLNTTLTAHIHTHTD